MRRSSIKRLLMVVSALMLEHLQARPRVDVTLSPLRTSRKMKKTTLRTLIKFRRTSVKKNHLSTRWQLQLRPITGLGLCRPGKAVPELQRHSTGKKVAKMLLITITSRFKAFSQCQLRREESRIRHRLQQQPLRTQTKQLKRMTEEMVSSSRLMMTSMITMDERLL